MRQSVHTAVPLGDFRLFWNSAGSFYDVDYRGRQQICQVYPYKGEQGTIGDTKKMFTVKAADYPGVGNLEQMVKGSDLLEYLNSIWMGRNS